MSRIELSTLVASLREEQLSATSVAVEHLLMALRLGWRSGQGSLLLVSPTGTGKSYIQGAIHRTMREEHKVEMVSTFPQSEIAEGVYKKVYGDHGYDPGSNAATGVLESVGFWTIKTLHNRLVHNKVKMPQVIQHDEAHHSVDNTHEVVHAIAGLCPRVGATATDYRGTLVETAKLRERWPRMHRVLTLADAVKKGRLSMPSWDVWPLLDDEQIEVTNGEFSISKVESHISDKLDDLVDRLAPFYSGSFDRPTMIAVPGVKAVEAVVDACNRVGLPAVGVTGDTSDGDRTDAFRKCVNREALLVQIRVVGEGVDLPIRRLIDLAPTVSPVLWMQRVGRITRPVPVGENAPEYIACCHNLARHAYLWHGLMPPSTIKKATEAWGKDFKPSRRFLARAIDVEGLGRFQPGAIPFTDAGTGTLYAMQTKDGLHQYAVVLHPLRPDPWFFGRSIPLTGEPAKKVIDTADGPQEVEYREKNYDAPEAKWRGIAKLPDLKGMISIKPGMLTEPQKNWWKKSAKNFGLDTTAEITNREFQILPILANSGVRLRV